ncbi:hypothetical protein [Alloalcanivorax mobilis]|uniref:hypothetical protein n=1 Tax=Alloalcanivorax mobilis TaxID=2019569 RepID=UPI000C756323|nr:hypothetical protein [Alloalcanivorax mobilis]
MLVSAHQKRHAGTLTATLLTLVLLAGCSDSSSPSDDTTSREPSPTAPADQMPAGGQVSDRKDAAEPVSPTRGGDGSEITLNALTEGDIGEAGLSGELGCQFTTAGGEVLLLAKGNVDSSDAAQGVVKVAGYVERVAAPGGFDGMTDSPTFNGKGKTVRIEVTGEPTEGGESPPRPASLTYDRADGAQRDWQGEWRCGP